MRKVLALVALLITKASYASCRYGQCEDVNNGSNSGNEIFFGFGAFVITLWLIFSENSPLSNYFYDKKGLGWLAIWLSPLVGSMFYFFLFK
ncbi:hypothetical protein [Vibrio harveyi]|uniref:hypothetical protein n=1 Tax=Vibrio harveyi TaxID=669 RepID=UPI0023806176|nr:hypothetical protein [Vibrio harveyi]